jgi:DNA-3-methyladenine glycosylase
LPHTPLDRAFYARATLRVARELIGLHLVQQRGNRCQVARIVETEAYQGPQDLAAHSARGRTARTEVMFGPPGHAYVYLIYGFWHCLNVITAAEGIPHGVLIRAAEPVEGIAGTTHGPGLLCRAFEIDRGTNGLDLCAPLARLSIEIPSVRQPVKIASSTRIGVDYAGAWAQKPWRFYDCGSPYVSTVTAAQRRKALAGMTISDGGMSATRE